MFVTNPYITLMEIFAMKQKKIGCSLTEQEYQKLTDFLQESPNTYCLKLFRYLINKPELLTKLQNLSR